MPRKTRKRTGRPSLRALRRLEEDREIVQVLVAETREGRHRRARVHARRALEVPDLEVDAELLRPDRREVRSAGEAAARVDVRVAVEAARLGEEACPWHGALREVLLLHPLGHGTQRLRAERLLRRRALV